MNLVLIEPGHGGWQKGCVHYSRDGTKYEEKDYNLDIAKRVMVLLEREWPVDLTRKTDVYVTPDQRKAIERRLKPSLVLSIHANSQAGAPTMAGMQTFYWPSNKRGRELATSILHTAPTVLRNHNWRRPFSCYNDPMMNHDDWIDRPRSVVGLYASTCVLVETGFFSYPGELEYLVSDDGMNSVSKCIAGAVSAWLKKHGGK